MKTVSILVFVGLACVVHSHVIPAESEDFFSTEIDGEKPQRSVEYSKELFDPVEEKNDEDDNEDDEGDNNEDYEDDDEIDAELEQPDR